MHDDDLIAAQQEEIEMLREKVRMLEDALASRGVPIPVEWRLTTSEAVVFAHLTTRDMATKQSIMTAMYSGRPDADEPEIKIVDVFVCKMRKKLKPFDVVIDTVWGQGYSLRDRQKYLEAA